MRLSPWTVTSLGLVFATGGLSALSAALRETDNSVLMNKIAKTVRVFFIGFAGSLQGFAGNRISYIRRCYTRAILEGCMRCSLRRLAVYLICGFLLSSPLLSSRFAACVFRRLRDRPGHGAVAG